MAAKLKIEKRGDEILKKIFLTYITGFFFNFELLSILTDYAN
jgi:hypothetical protein